MNPHELDRIADALSASGAMDTVHAESFKRNYRDSWEREYAEARRQAQVLEASRPWYIKLFMGNPLYPILIVIVLAFAAQKLIS
jgi:hypothetical protein